MAKDLEQPTPPKPSELAQRGVDLCRDGRFKDGLEWLLIAVNANGNKTEGLPAVAVSHLGYSMAKVEGQKRKGLRLCREAIRREFYHPECYALLAKVYLLSGEKQGAIEAIQKGLKIDPESTGLHVLQQELGVRRPPPIPALSRNNPLNRLLSSFRKPAAPPAKAHDRAPPGAAEKKAGPRRPPSKKPAS